MSGTSADAADAALVSLTFEPRPAVHLLAFVHRPYPATLRDRILHACRPDGGSAAFIAHLHAELGETFAAAAQSAAEEAVVAIDSVDVIGSHGQTVFHAGAAAGAIGATLQLGEPAVIAERTGCTVVSSFRARDVAAGGQGAPLVPYVDWLLLRSDAVGRVLLNIGGIANVTVLPAGADLDRVIGFDTGPGNVLLDAIVTTSTGRRELFDRDGTRASMGTVDHVLLERLLLHPYFAQPPPKSTGRELFGEQMAAEVRAASADDSAATNDLLATLTALTATSIARAIERFVLPRTTIQELYVSGGGAHNRAVMDMLRAQLPGLHIGETGDIGIDGAAKECVAFAVLAVETLRGGSANVPTVTGARRPVLLGSITPGRRLSVLQEPASCAAPLPLA